MATFYSREFRNAEQAYISSLASIDRVKTARPDDQRVLSDSSVRINEEQLRTLGMSEAQIHELGTTRQVTGDIQVLAPSRVLFCCATSRQRSALRRERNFIASRI